LTPPYPPLMGGIYIDPGIGIGLIDPGIGINLPLTDPGILTR